MWVYELQQILELIIISQSKNNNKSTALENKQAPLLFV
jgi:hypothetical protein